MSKHQGTPMTNRIEAEGWLEQLAGALIDGTTDPITPMVAAAAVTHALLDVADAVREQTATLNETYLNLGVRTVEM